MSVQPAPQSRSRPWLWYFVLLIVLSLTAVVIQVWYARGRLLTLDKLLAAQQRWREQGPASYDLKYTFDKAGGKDEYHVEVRGGKVISVTRNGQPVEERLYRYSSMPALLGFAETTCRTKKMPSKASIAPRLRRLPSTIGLLRRFVHGGTVGDRVKLYDAVYAGRWIMKK